MRPCACFDYELQRWESCACFNRQLQRWTSEITAYREHLERMNGMGRLEDKFATAAGVVGRQNAKIEARLDRIIEREGSIERKTDDAFVPHETLLAGLESGLDKVEASLRLLSNGDPNESPSASPASQEGRPAASQLPGSTASTEPGI